MTTSFFFATESSTDEGHIFEDVTWCFSALVCLEAAAATLEYEQKRVQDEFAKTQCAGKNDKAVHTGC